MNVKERIESIQNSIDSLQDYINGLDQNFQYYNVLIPDQCQNPMQIRIFRRINDGEFLLIKAFLVNFLDPYPDSTNNLNSNALEAEFEYLNNSNAPQEQRKELMKIKKLLGI